jgi:hypothetical protein
VLFFVFGRFPPFFLDREIQAERLETFHQTAEKKTVGPGERDAAATTLTAVF